MKFRSKIWLLPLSVGATFGLGLLISLVLGLNNNRTLESLRSVDTPYLDHLFQAERRVNQLQADFQAAALEDEADRLKDAQTTAQEVRKSLTQAHQLEGKAALTSGLVSAFESYQAAALEATQAMLKKTVTPELVARMNTAQKELARQTQLTRQQAHVTLDERFVSLAAGQRESLLINAITGLLIVLGLGLGSRAIIASVWKDLGGEPTELRNVAHNVADGDLNHISSSAVGDHSSLSAAMDVMTAYLRDIVGAIRQTSHAIADASHAIADGNQDLSSRTEQTTTNLQRLASELGQLTGSVNHSAAAALQASALATTAAGAAQSGGNIVSQVVASMNDINQASRKITDIIGVIDGIAFQTNILALNAAVEAARAGEQGRGFAVVASEVRLLAGRSAQAAREIKTLIGTSGEKVENGLRLVTQAGCAMGEIVEGVQQVVRIISEIGTDTSEQTSSIHLVNQEIAELDQMTQQNATLVQASAAAAGRLQEQAAQLVQVVAVFKMRD